MRNALLFTLLLALLPVSVLAQENFTTIDLDQTSLSFGQKLSGVKTFTEQKYEGLSPTGKITTKYYDYCMAQAHPLINFWAKKKQCLCTADRVAERMAPNEILLMGEDTERGQEMRRKMLEYHFVPCMLEPMEMVVQKLCESDKAMMRKMRNPDEMCSCLADTVSRSTVQRREHLVGIALRDNPDTAFPLATFLDSREFFQTSERYMKSCFTHFEKNLPPYPGLTPAQRTKQYREQQQYQRQQQNRQR